MTAFRPGDRVRFWSSRHMDDIYGRVEEVKHNQMIVKWDDEACRRVYDLPLSTHRVEIVPEEEEK